MYRYVLIAFVIVSRVVAATPDGVSYQGFLQNTDGSPLSGAVDLQFAIWNSPVSNVTNDQLYVEDHIATQVVNGLFSVELGAGNVVFGTFDPNLFAESDRWLETIVNGESLSPRTKFLSVPYALRAQHADFLSGMTGAVMHFALPQCPAGWSELAEARGRTLVGLPTSGTLAGTSGIALGDLENRQHDHTVTTPATTTGSSPTHTHVVSSHNTTSDTHNHRWSTWNGSLRDWVSFNSTGAEFTITNWTDGMDQAGSGIYPIAASSSGTTTIYTDNDAHSHSVNSQSTGSGGSHNHVENGTVSTSSGANSNPTLPYLQLLVCVKN